MTSKTFLYGKNREMHKSFDHDVFAENVYKCPHKFMITYNVNERLEELYKDYERMTIGSCVTLWHIVVTKALMIMSRLNFGH